MGFWLLILLDTHIWVWWVSGRVLPRWEVAKLIQVGRLQLDRPVSHWIDAALSDPRLELLPITPAIAVESTRLPGAFHRDPADQLIVATARIQGIQLLSEDSKILAYPHVERF